MSIPHGLKFRGNSPTHAYVIPPEHATKPYQNNPIRIPSPVPRRSQITLPIRPLPRHPSPHPLKNSPHSPPRTSPTPPKPSHFLCSIPQPLNLAPSRNPTVQPSPRRIPGKLCCTSTKCRFYPVRSVKGISRGKCFPKACQEASFPWNQEIGWLKRCRRASFHVYCVNYFLPCWNFG